jgi:hypothetical protein
MTEEGAQTLRQQPTSRQRWQETEVDASSDVTQPLFLSEQPPFNYKTLIMSVLCAFPAFFSVVPRVHLGPDQNDRNIS